MDSFVHDRSSSQPRPSHPADRLSSSMPMTSRRAPQPTALHNTHFLDGFNVADCYDVRAIPDPPSPSPSPHNTTSGHRRRVSSAVLRPMSSRDITNRGNNPCTLTSESDGVKLSSSVRRKRKTLSHVPSPMISGEEQNHVLHSTDALCNEGFSSGEKRPNTVRINSFQDDSFYETARNYPKRRRKRQSMVIPSDLSFEEKTIELPKLPSPKESQRKKSSFYPGDFKNMQKLRNLVRGYCSISSDEERRASDVGKEIQALTGYALPRRVVTKGDGDKSQAMLSNRRLVIQKIAPVLAQIEKRKERDAKQWESTTGCHVTKSVRSGRYRYYDIESNQRVASQEYKRRYIAFLENSRPDRLARAQAWMNKLSPVEEDYFKMHSNSFPIYHDPDSIHDARQHYNPMDYCEMKQKEAFDPPRSNSLKRVDSTESRYLGTTDRMDICDMSMSLDYGEQQSVDTSMYNNNCQVLPPTMATRFDRSEIAEISEASSEDTDDNPNESRSSSPTHDSDFMGAADKFEAGESVVLDAREARDDNGSSKMEKGGKDTDESVPLLPFPSRCRESMDPEIAAAERRLWDKIDLALHEYSGEVMMIEKKKQEAK